MRRARRAVQKPPDLTSLLDVLFILIFAALIRAAAADQNAQAASKPAPQPAPVPLDPQSLRARALADLGSQLAARPSVVLRVSVKGTLTAMEENGKAVALDTPLLEHSPDPDVAVSYLGDRSAELRLCRIAALHLGAADLGDHLVIIAPDTYLAELPHALFEGLHHDVDHCLTDQRGIAVIVDPTAAKPSKP
ncbi:MAG: hypothetical protein JWO36_6915 [Myxococcales bacterium]|nr:hypothetical protein [Myxococcales bacterium]